MSAIIQGGGDVVGPASSVDGETALFSGTSGKLIKRATGTGVVTLASGVQTANATLPIANMPTGSILQNVAAPPIINAVSNGGAVIPLDDSPPEWTEGALLISFSITPLVATSRIHLVCTGMFTLGSGAVVGNGMNFGVFRGVGASSFYASAVIPSGMNFLQSVALDCFDTPGAGTFTYTVKYGGTAIGYAVVGNASSSGRYFGGDRR